MGYFYSLSPSLDFFEVKQEKRDNALNAKKTRETKQKLMAILATKQDEELQSKSQEEIKEMIDELG